MARVIITVESGDGAEFVRLPMEHSLGNAQAVDLAQELLRAAEKPFRLADRHLDGYHNTRKRGCPICA